MPADTVDPQIIPYLYYDDATAAIEFMASAFGFVTLDAFRHPDSGAVLHATVDTGRGRIFVGPGMEEFGTRGTPDADRISSMTYVYVDDVDAHFRGRPLCPSAVGGRSNLGGTARTFRRQPPVHGKRPGRPALDVCATDITGVVD